jgi:hypothetical protein
LAGTFKATRHRTGAAPEDDGPEWRPAPGDLQALGRSGRRLVRKLLAAFAPDPLDGVIVLELAHGLDRLDEFDEVDRAALAEKARAAHDRARRLTSAHVAMLWAKLKATLR